MLWLLISPDRQTQIEAHEIRLGKGGLSLVVSRSFEHHTGDRNEDQTQSKPCFSHVTTLEEDLKQQPLCQDSPGQRCSIGFRSEIVPFHSFQNRDPPDTPQQSELGEVVHYHPSE
ncbi:hypothetical protein TNCV_2005101 [Trichonephila clavipes]|nr:hypothetical protein TNCV_2005101 [Trichonephila clavipes]